MPTPTPTPPPASLLDQLSARLHLPESEVFRKLLEAAPDAVLVVHPTDGILYANSQTEQMFGYERTTLIGRQVELLIPERMRGRHIEHRSDYMRSPGMRPMGLNMTLTARRADGSEFPVEISLSPIALDSISVTFAGIRDISRLQSAREAVARGRYSAYVAQLGQQVIGLRDLDSLLGTVPPLVASALDADVVVVYLPSADSTEFVCRAAHGVPAHLLSALTAKNDASRAPGFIVSGGAAVIVEDYATENRFAPDPTIAALGLTSALGVPILGEGGPVGVLSVRTREQRRFSEDDRNFLQSVGNVVGAAMKCLKAEEQLRHSQRIEAVGQLTGGIAHDFNNLLTVIIGNLQIIAEDVAGNEAVGGPLDAALRAASSAADLTRKLLAFSRRQALRPRPIDVNELVGGMLDMIRRTLGERITILAFPDPSLPTALADPGQLETALLNLVVNARDAMPGGGRLTIETGLRTLEEDYVELNADVRAGEYAMIAVSDNGVGMPPHVLKCVFDPYFTTKERGKGTGLGLSMVHGFAKQTGGHIALYSEPGRGTTARLYLPLSDATANYTRPAVLTELSGGKEVVLLVEDEAGVRELGARFLGALGYSVYPTGDAATALTLLDGHPDIDLLFTDIVLPGPMDGVELAREARRRRPALRVLFTSGYASAAIDALDALDAPLLDKPYRRENLAQAIRSALDSERP